MGQQASFLSLTGNIGKLTFYKNKDGFMVREKGGVSKERIMTDPRYARTRENMAEFANAASAVKLLKDAVRPAIVRTADRKVHGRLQRLMVKVVKSDTFNSRGERTVLQGNWNLLKGFEFNRSISFADVLRVPVTITETAGNLNVSIAPFNPADYLLAPQGSTDCRIYLIGASIGVGSTDHSMFRVNSDLFSTSGQTSPISLDMDKTELTYNHRVYVLGVDFVQMVNEQECALHSSQYNAATIIQTERV